LKTLFTILARFLATISHSQNINYGFKFGVNISSFSGTLGEESRSRTGFHIGGFYEEKTSDNFAISPEILFSQQGVRFDGDSRDEGFTDLRLNYVSLSVNAKFF
jgi:hypothetical protein